MLPLVKVLIVVAIGIGVHHTVRTGLNDLDKMMWEFHPGWLALAGALYLIAMVPAALFWRQVMRAIGQQADRWETIRAYMIGHLGKYVPGKAMVIVLRTGLIRGHRVDTALAAIAIFVETLTMMAVGALLAAAVLTVLYWEQWLLVLLALGLMVVTAVPTAPPVFRRLVKILGKKKLPRQSLRQVDQLTYRVLALGWVAMAFCWIIQGVGLWATLRGMGVVDVYLVSDLPFLTATMALSIVLGFIAMIPAGAGVREFVLLTLLAPRFGEATALASAVVVRLISLVAELGISVILYLIKRPDRESSERRDLSPEAPLAAPLDTSDRPAS